MFSIKQFIINLSSEARQELRKLIDEIEASLVKEEVSAPVKTKTKAIEATTEE